MTNLPKNINQLGVLLDGTTRQVNLWDNGLSDETIEQLKKTPHEGMQFNVSMLAMEDDVRFNNLNEAFAF